jgi:uncharacterized protein DUF2865
MELFRRTARRQGARRGRVKGASMPVRFRLAPMLALAALAFATPACAQGLFDMIFNGDRYAPRPSRGYAPPHAYSDPSNPSDRPVYAPSGGAPQVSHGTGRAVSYCVRLCDGRYFPIQRHANANSAQLCNAFCPAAKTQVFNGSQIDHAYASNGARYADLDNAFVYREKIVDNCTCNGKDSFGLARIDINADPTLRQGDIVASGDNVKAALIAMAASKERREAAAERPALRGSVSRRAALPAGATPGSTPPAAASADEAMPED